MRLEEAGLLPKSRSLARDVLARALGLAEQSNVVGRNVARIVQGPKWGARFPTPSPWTRRRRCSPRQRGTGSRPRGLALRLGIRQGEALGLRWVDVDLEPASSPSTKGKTAAAARTVPLVAGTAAALKEHRRRQAAERLAAGPLWIDTGHVFTTPRGTPIHPRIALGWWHELTEAAALDAAGSTPPGTPGGAVAGPGRAVGDGSAVLGHANLAITADVYGRITQDAKRRALSKLDESDGG